jgi:hypothetical protein
VAFAVAMTLGLMILMSSSFKEACDAGALQWKKYGILD